MDFYVGRLLSKMGQIINRMLGFCVAREMLCKEVMPSNLQLVLVMNYYSDKVELRGVEGEITWSRSA
jgi:hypothetical protein